MFCFQCGAQLPENSKFCTQCGKKTIIFSELNNKKEIETEATKDYSNMKQNPDHLKKFVGTEKIENTISDNLAKVGAVSGPRVKEVKYNFASLSDNPNFFNS